MNRQRRSRRILIGICAAVAALVLLLVVAWSAGLVLHDSSEAASLEQALADFRAGNREAVGLEGVYLYASEGRESIDALGGAAHSYPSTTAIAVSEVPCGVELHWAALEGRSTTWTFCSTQAGIEFSRSDERHGFFGRSDHTVYDCRNRVLIPKRRSARKAFPFRCRSRRAVENGQVRILGEVWLEVGDDRRRALHVRSSLSIHGGDAGSEVIDWWLDERTSLPLRITLKSRTSRPLFVGRVHYHEDFTIRLLSLRPRR